MDQRRARAELAAVLITGVAFLVFENLLDLKLPFLIGCALIWTLYLAWRAVKVPASLREWGVRADNLGPASRACAAFLLPAAGGMLLYRLVRGWSPLPSSSLFIFLLYPLWGFVQQFLIQGLAARNLRRLGTPASLVIPAAAALFGLAHLPDWPLVALCAGAGTVWTAIYLRTPNLIPLAFTHGWLGALAYY